MRAVELLRASGHPRITAGHETTLEITREKDLTDRGDCIIAIDASKGASDLSRDFLRLTKNDATRITMRIALANLEENVVGRGDRRLTLSHPTDLVVRKSAHVCGRTVMVEADKSACDLDRNLVKALRDPSSTITIEIVAESA